MMKLVLFVCALHLCVWLTQSKPDAEPNPRIFTDDPFVDENKFVEVVFRHEIVSVVGEETEIPCDIAENIPTERPKLVLWYKGNNKLPLYTLDLRGKSEGHHWKDNKTLGDRGLVRYQETAADLRKSRRFQWTSALKIDPVQKADGGIYRCRIDFANLPTYNAWIKIKIVVPPAVPVLQNENGKVLGTISDPLQEGESYSVHCLTAGDPVPSVVWYLSNIPLQPVATNLDSFGELRSTVLLRNVNQRQNGDTLTCQVRNNDMTGSVSTSVNLNILSPPKEIKIVKELSSFQAGSKYNLTCQVLGSYPNPSVTVSRGSRTLPIVSRTDNIEQTVYSVVAEFEAMEEDNNEFLTCRAVNRHLPAVRIEDQWKIEIFYGPEVEVRRKEREEQLLLEEEEVHLMERVDRMETVVEGGHLNLVCSIHANPPVEIIHWYRQDHDLETLMEDNIMIMGQNLHISNIRRSQSGNYSCAAANSVRLKKSEPFPLFVHYAPECLKPKNILYGALGDILVLKCEMKSSEQTSRFAWSVGEDVRLANRFTYANQESVATSYLEYKINSHSDFTGISCQANNSFGSSSKPCVFQIKAKDNEVPELKSCSSMDHSYTSFTIYCKVTRKFENNLLEFSYEVFDAETSKFFKRVSTYSPNITFVGLPSSMDFIVDVYVKGNDAPYKIDAFTLRTNEKQIAASTEKNVDVPFRFITIIGVLAGILLIIVTFAGVIVMMKRKARRQLERHGSFSTDIKNNIIIQTSNANLYSKQIDDSLNGNTTESLVDSYEVRPYTEVNPDIKVMDLCANHSKSHQLYQQQQQALHQSQRLSVLHKSSPDITRYFSSDGVAEDQTYSQQVKYSTINKGHKRVKFKDEESRWNTLDSTVQSTKHNHGEDNSFVCLATKEVESTL